MDRLLPFKDLWDLAQAQEKHHNTLCYHPCCDLWTTKNSKTNRASHSKAFTWTAIINSLPKDCLNKPQALEAKMIEEGWSLPATLNKPCKNQPLPKPLPLPISFTTPVHSSSEGLQNEGFIEPKNISDGQTFSLPPRSQCDQEK